MLYPCHHRSFIRRCFRFSSGTRRVAAEALFNHVRSRPRGPQRFLPCFGGSFHVTWAVLNICWWDDMIYMIWCDMGMAVYYPAFFWGDDQFPWTRNHVFKHSLSPPNRHDVTLEMCSEPDTRVDQRPAISEKGSRPLSQAYSRKCHCSFWVCWMLLYPQMLQQCAVWMGSFAIVLIRISMRMGLWSRSGWQQEGAV